MIRICVVDDHELIREGVKKIIQSSRNMRIVGEATSIVQAGEVVARSRPDVIVLDLKLGEDDGLDGFRKLHQKFPGIPVIILSMYPEERYALPALKMGASGYVSKNMAAEELVRAVTKVTAGSTYISTGFAEVLARQLFTRAADPSPYNRLTKRELEVLTMLASGKLSRQIAEELSLGISTVNTYRSRIFRKTGLRTTAALVRYAVEHGLV